MPHVVIGAGMVAVLLLFFVPNVIPKSQRSVNPKWRVDCLQLESALRLYAEDHAGWLPERLDELLENDARGVRYFAASRVPRDPWGHVYRYERDPEPRVWSGGRDGVDGTADDLHLDRSSWFTTR